MPQSPRLELRQQQSLVMTAQLQQSIKLLQLSSLELAEFVEQEVEKNPLLEMEEEREKIGAEAEELSREAGAEEHSPPEERAAEGRDLVDLASAPELDTRDALLDTGGDGEWDGGDYLRESAFDSHARGSGVPESFQSPGASGVIEQTASEGATLREHLLQQAQMDIADPAQRMIGSHLVDLLDDAGYLRADLDDVAVRLGCGRALLDATLARMQQFDPPGIFARSLAECLALQLKERDRFDPAMETLIAHLDLLAAGEYGRLMRLCGVDAGDLKDMIAEIRLLDPKPAGRFTAEVSQSVEPDVLVRLAKSGGWHVELSAHALPRVLVNRRYYAELSGRSRKKQEKKFLSEQLSNANWLVKALDQRAQTVLKVSAEIVRRQDGFFHHGIGYLRPLTLREVAEEVALHESTVSRVTSNKFMLTPRGLFELKYFFTSSVHGAGGGAEDDVSSMTVKHYIRELVEREIPDRVLSDEAIVEALKDKGVQVARRTVTKYREAMHIPSSVQRRRRKKAIG